MPTNKRSVERWTIQWQGLILVLLSLLLNKCNSHWIVCPVDCTLWQRMREAEGCRVYQGCSVNCIKGGSVPTLVYAMHAKQYEIGKSSVSVEQWGKDSWTLNWSRVTTREVEESRKHTRNYILMYVIIHHEGSNNNKSKKKQEKKTD